MVNGQMLSNKAMHTLSTNDVNKAKEISLDYFRKIVSFIYREIGVFEKGNHPKLYEKSKMIYTGFSHQRKERAREIYHKTISLNSTRKILAYYEEETGFTLHDIFIIFQEGNWERGDRCYFGGPKWAKIVATTIELQNIINNEQWSRVPEIVDHINNLKHNTGKIIDKFSTLKVANCNQYNGEKRK
jgi:hypothetical protein